MREPAKPLDVMIAICALILIGGALSLARSVFAPVAFALFVIAIVWPFQSRLQAALPKVLALAISIIVTTVVITAFGSLIAWGFSRVVRYVISDATRLQGLYTQMSDWLETHGIMLAGLWAEHFNVQLADPPAARGHEPGQQHDDLPGRRPDLRHPGSARSRRCRSKARQPWRGGRLDGCCWREAANSREAPPVHARSNPDERHDRRARVGVCRLHRARTRA